MAWLSGKAIDKVAKLVKEWQGDVSFRIVHFNSSVTKADCPYVPSKGYELIEDVYHHNNWYYLALIYKIKKSRKKA